MADVIGKSSNVVENCLRLAVECASRLDINDQRVKCILDVFELCCIDTRWEVRESCLLSLQKILRFSVCVEQCEPVLLRACADGESYVRATAISTLAKYLSFHSSIFLKQKFCKLLQVLCEDDEALVRREAMRQVHAYLAQMDNEDCHSLASWLLQ